MKETKKRRYIVSTIMYGMILIFIQLPWVVLKGKNYSIYAAYFRIKAKGIKALSEMAVSVWDGNITIIRIQLILLIVFQIVIDRKSTRLNSSHPSSSRMPSSA